MQAYHEDELLLPAMRDFVLTLTPESVFKAKDEDLIEAAKGGCCLIKARNELIRKGDWCGGMSAIVRNAPDHRGVRTTILTNHDTIAVLLATMIGINHRVAIALAFDDIIKACSVNNLQFRNAEFAAENFVVLATFTPHGEKHPNLALIAHKDARNFKLRFAPEELILYDQHPQHGLFRPFSESYFVAKHKPFYSYRTNETVVIHEEGVLRNSVPAQRSDFSALVEGPPKPISLTGSGEVA